MFALLQAKKAPEVVTLRHCARFFNLILITFKWSKNSIPVWFWILFTLKRNMKIPWALSLEEYKLYKYRWKLQTNTKLSFWKVPTESIYGSKRPDFDGRNRAAWVVVGWKMTESRAHLGRIWLETILQKPKYISEHQLTQSHNIYNC